MVAMETITSNWVGDDAGEVYGEGETTPIFKDIEDGGEGTDTIIFGPDQTTLPVTRNFRYRDGVSPQVKLPPCHRTFQWLENTSEGEQI